MSDTVRCYFLIWQVAENSERPLWRARAPYALKYGLPDAVPPDVQQKLEELRLKQRKCVCVGGLADGEGLRPIPIHSSEPATHGEWACRQYHLCPPLLASLSLPPPLSPRLHWWCRQPSVPTQDVLT